MQNLGEVFTATPEQMEAVKAGMIVFACMDDTGDTKSMWNPDNEDEVEAAKSMFDKLTGKGFSCFKVEGTKGDKGEQVREFDPTAGRYIFTPRLQGG